MECGFFKYKLGCTMKYIMSHKSITSKSFPQLFITDI